MGTIANNDNLYGVAKWIVDSIAGKGTHTTIAAALTSSSSGDTIFIRPGTYTENITLKAGVNIVSFIGEELTPNVSIVGKATMTTAGTVTISGIRLTTNSDFFLAVTGSAASKVRLVDCYLNCLNNTGISFTSSDSTASIQVFDSSGSLGTTGIGVVTSSSAGTILFERFVLGNTGGSSTASSTSSGAILLRFCNWPHALSTSSTGTVSIFCSNLGLTAQNTTCVTTAGTGSSGASYSDFGGGTASCLSIGSGTTFEAVQCSFTSSNTNCITGAGTFNYQGLSFGNSSGQTINVTTQTGGTIQGGVFQAPSAGFLGEQIRATVAANGNSLSNNTATNLTSISLTAGIWDVSLVMGFSGMTTGTALRASISTTSATEGTSGDNRVDFPFLSQAAQNLAITIPSYRLTLTSTTTVYAVGYAAYTVGTGTFYGRISATRVG